ncbi:MAG: hypothetical protein ACOH2M_32820 [Cypionkella sp.]
MNWLAKQFGRALTRRLAFLLVVALLGWAGVGHAESLPTKCNENPRNCDKEQAYAVCMVDTAERAKAFQRVTDKRCRIPQAGNTYWQGEFYMDQFNNGNYAWAGANIHPFSPCPVGTEWNDTLKKCDIPCSTKPPLGPTVGLLQNEVCVQGCMYSGVPTNAMSFTSDGAPTINLGTFDGFTPTGDYCPSGQPDQAKEEPYCEPIAGQLVCARSDGQHCAKAATTGKFFCWRPGETGEKTDGPDKQVINAGETPIAPNLSLPSGDTLAPVGAPVTINNTYNNGATSTRTTSNYSTNQGTNANGGNTGTGTGSGPGGTDGQGEGGENGPGKGKGDGKGDGDKGTMSGGSSCADPPACAGGDLIMCGLLKVQHMTGCLAEKGIRDFMGEPYDETDGTEGVELGDVIADEDFDATSVDDSGFGFSRSCPSPPAFYDTTLDMDGLCTVAQWIGVLIAALGLLQAAYVLGGER